MRQFETQETDSNGLPRYAVGSGAITPGGVSMSFTWSYINPQNEAVVHQKQVDKERTIQADDGLKRH